MLEYIAVIAKARPLNSGVDITNFFGIEFFLIGWSNHRF